MGTEEYNYEEHKRSQEQGKLKPIVTFEVSQEESVIQNELIIDEKRLEKKKIVISEVSKKTGENNSLW